jgi:hypothetical protein
MTDQNRTQPQNQPPQDAGRRDRDADEQPDRFDKKQQDRTRAVPEQANQGHGPLNVGDQSRTRG